MRKFRIVLLLIMSILCIVFTNELYFGYLSKYEANTYVYIEELDSENIKERYERIVNILLENEINDFCFIDKIDYGEKGIRINIYFDVNYEKYLKKDLIVSGNFSSLNGNKIKVSYYNIEDFYKKNIITDKSILCINANKQKLIYTFGKDKIIFNEENNTIKMMLCAVCVVFVLFWWFLLAVNCQQNKKEWALKIYNGYPIWMILVLSILKEICISCCTFYLPVRIFCGIWGYVFCEKYILGLLLLIVLVSAIIVIYSFCFVDYKKSLNNSYGNEVVRALAFFCRNLVLIITSLILFFCIIKFDSCLMKIHSKTFYEQFKGKYHLIPHSNITENDYWEICETNNIYKIYKNELGIIIWTYNEVHDGDNSIIPVILANSNSQFLIEEYFEICVPEMDKDILLSKNDMNANWETILNSLIFYSDDNIKCYYSKDVSVPVFNGTCVDKKDDTIIVENPVIYIKKLDEMSEFELNAIRYFDFNQTAITIKPGSIERIINQTDNIAYFETYNIYNEYKDRLKKDIIQFEIFVVLFVICVLFDVYFLNIINDYEHRINAVETILYKINGMPVIKRYSLYIYGSVIALMISTLLMIIFSYELYDKIKCYVFISSIMVSAIEIASVIFSCIRWENKNTIKILKGGVG